MNKNDMTRARVVNKVQRVRVEESTTMTGAIKVGELVATTSVARVKEPSHDMSHD